MYIVAQVSTEYWQTQISECWKHSYLVPLVYILHHMLSTVSLLHNEILVSRFRVSFGVDMI